MKKYLVLCFVFVCLGCSAPQEDPAGAAAPGGDKGVSAAISSLFEPTADQKAHSAEMQARRQEMERQAEEMQKERLQSY